MTQGRTIQESKETIYDKNSSGLAEYSNDILIEEDFSNQNINHTILKTSKIIRSNFNKASLTGSIFNECEFIDCSMNVPDLEYCRFCDCKFQSSTRRRFVASINNSTFIRTYFTKVTFYGCSFAESYFEECRFDMTKLEYSTLENAVYRCCEFIGMNFNNSNLQFSEWEKNTFFKCIMSIHQPTYMIGGLEICATEDPGVQFISSDGKMYSSKEYIDNILPLLLIKYIEREEYFPAANIYIFQKNYVEAMRMLKKGLLQAISYRDFRMLKFYCKLIVHAKVFDSHTLYDFYHSICRFLPQEQNSNAEMHIYMRNIGEIKSILFQSSKRPSLHTSFITNIFSKNADKVGLTIERLFRIAKMKGVNQCEVLLHENSPLIIDIN
ncbi:MAG: pentapeptide repeat-containing protein, partial [Acetatifactor sp.]|nr:pentapeptide repeat-containing protein [Acetatifactor sp.]